MVKRGVEREKGVVDKENKDEPWWVEWVELLAKLTGVTDLIKQASALKNEKDKQALTKALNKISKEGNNKQIEFLKKINDLLIIPKADQVDEIVSLVEQETNKSGVGLLLGEAMKDKESRQENLIKAKEITENKRKIAERRMEPILNRVADNTKEMNELKFLISEVASHSKQLTPEEKSAKMEALFVTLESQARAAKEIKKSRGIKTSVKEKLQQRVGRNKAKYAKNIWDKIDNDEKDKVSLTEEEQDGAISFLLDLLEQGREEEFEIFLDRLEDRVESTKFNNLFDEFSKKLFDESNQSSNKKWESTAKPGSKEAEMSDYIDFLRNEFSDEEIAQRLGGAGSVSREHPEFSRLPNDSILNLDRKIYIDINEKLSTMLGGKKAIVEFSDRRIPSVNPELSDTEKKLVNDYFQERMYEQVRMLTDESVGLNEARGDYRGTEYVTLMSVMGLDTSKKSVIMKKTQFIMMSYLMFNEYNNKDLYGKVLEMASHMGPEFNIYSQALMSKDRFTVTFEVTNAEGKAEKKEIEIGNLSQMDFVTVGQQRIKPEDKARYGMDPKAKPPVERTHAEMMFASPLKSERDSAKIPLTRLVLKEQLGDVEYQRLLREAGAILVDGSINESTENKFLESIGNKYWDYYNGIYVYMAMNQSLGESVINCNPKNGDIKIPQGIPELIFKMNPETWGTTFNESYNPFNFPGIMQTIRHMGITSMGAKEGKEVFSYLLNQNRDGVGRASILDAFYNGANLDDNEKKWLDDIRDVAIEALYESDEYHIGGAYNNPQDHKKKHQLEHLAERTHIYDGVEVKIKGGKKDFDPTMHRRDLTSSRELFVVGLTKLNRDKPKMFEKMDFTLLKEKFAHDTILMAAFDNTTLSNFEKIKIFAERIGDDKMLFRQLSGKRGDDPMKYAGEYYEKFSQAVTELAEKPTYARAIKVLRVIQSIVGVGKISPIAHLMYKNIKELREERELGEVVVFEDKDSETGGFKFDQGNYIGTIPGRKVVPDIYGRKVGVGDILEGKGKTSKAAMMGFADAIDEEFDTRAGLKSMKTANLLLENFYKKIVDEEKREKRGIDWHKPKLGEAWKILTGKKVLDYIAIEWFHVPPELFMELVLGGGIEFTEIWLNYFNGSGGSRH